MKINQLLPTLSYGDAVSNSAINMMEVLHSMGINSKIYAENIDPKVKHLAENYKKCPKDEPVIYHLSTGSDLSEVISDFTKEKILLYHNVTPKEFFKGYNGTLQKLCDDGRKQMESLNGQFDYSWADSKYNEKELIEAKYKNTKVQPIIINFEDYTQNYNVEVYEKMKTEGYVNILFVGRIAPNKKHQDIIKSFYYYKKYINPKSRLILVGSANGTEMYLKELQNLIAHLELEDVHIIGHVSFSEILAYYRSADLFLCMSEHEGFCVPLLEAMHFELPIIAYKSSAVPETLSNGGIVVTEKNFKYIAELMDIVLSNNELKKNIVNNQKNILNYYSKENVKQMFQKSIEEIFSKR